MVTENYRTHNNRIQIKYYNNKDKNLNGWISPYNLKLIQC